MLPISLDDLISYTPELSHYSYVVAFLCIVIGLLCGRFKAMHVFGFTVLIPDLRLLASTESVVFLLVLYFFILLLNSSWNKLWCYFIVWYEVLTWKYSVQKFIKFIYFKFACTWSKKLWRASKLWFFWFWKLENWSCK